MLYKAKVAVCSDIRTKHSTQSERHVEFLNVKPGRYVKKPLGFKRLMSPTALCGKEFLCCAIHACQRDRVTMEKMKIGTCKEEEMKKHYF